MQLTNILTLLAATSLTTALAIDKRTGGGDWTIQDFTRTCDAHDTCCTYSYTVATPTGSECCEYQVTGSPASRAEVPPRSCGSRFQVSSAWSGQFGEGNGFTTFAVTDHKQIVWPAYADHQITNGVAVKPDQSYPPTNLW